MGRVARKRMHKNIRDNKRQFRTRAREKDLDQIHEDLKPENTVKIIAKANDNAVELPGLGKFPCIECSRYFIDGKSLEDHLKSKIHKKRLKLLKEEPFTIKEAEAAVGLMTENSRSQPMVEDYDSSMLLESLT